MNARWLMWLPLAIFAALAVLFMAGLFRPDDGTIASRMVGKPMPAFDLPAAASDRPGLSTADLADGKPRMVNVFASWCLPCAAESSQLAALAAQGVPIDGIAIRDAREDVDAFLARNGNPFDHIGLDARSSVQLAIGSSGVPETFIVDGRGRIVHQHISDIRPEDVPRLIEIWKGAQ
ncbi:MAG: redoxin family protein [Sphingobium sp.]